MSRLTEPASGRRSAPRRPGGAAGAVVETLAVSTVAGVLVGAVWSLLVPGGAQGSADVVAPERQFATDAWFAIVGAGAGALLAPVLHARHRRRPLVVLYSLVAGGVLGSLTAWGCGMLFGLDDLGLGATGVLLAWPIAATLGTLAVSALADDGGDDDGGASAAAGPVVSSAERSRPSWPP
ncbi:MAG: hypothetical protein ICV70_02930 [Jiangellaceae bacterium]|nr:hypothetical protein [Jiangellaceae bacterium]